MITLFDIEICFHIFTMNVICTGDGEQKEQLQDVEDQDVS